MCYNSVTKGVSNAKRKEKKMTRFEEAVRIIAEGFRRECEERECTIAELFKCYQMDTDDFRTEFLSILNHSDFPACDFTDECEIFDEDGTVRTLLQLIKAVRNYGF